MGIMRWSGMVGGPRTRTSETRAYETRGVAAPLASRRPAQPCPEIKGARPPLRRGLTIKGGLTLERGGIQTVLDIRQIDDIISTTAMQVAAVYLERK